MSKNNHEESEQDHLISDPALGLSVEVPSITPSIMVDQNGYRTGARKTLVVRGVDVPDRFYIYNSYDDTVVYTGDLREVSVDSQTGVHEYVGTFTDLQENGTYYAYCDKLGSSYLFSIDDSIYYEIFSEACRRFYLNRCGMNLTEEYAGTDAHQACHTAMASLASDPSKTLDVSGGWHMDENAGRDTSKGCRIAENLLLAYEINENSFTDDAGFPESGNGVPDILDEVQYEVEWLLKMQDSESGGVYASAITEPKEGQELSLASVYVTDMTPEASIEFATVLAHFGYLFQEYDKAYAGKCLDAARKAYQYYASKSEETSPAMFNAAAQLYRYTGDKEYEKILTAFFTSDGFYSKILDNSDLFFGAVAYISTSKPVNTEVCNNIMNSLMDRAEDINARSKRSAYEVCSISEDGDQTKLLDEMRILTVIDHVIYNYEYTMIIENHAHYLCGRNPEGINYVTDSTDYTYRDAEGIQSVMNDPEHDAELIFMLGVIK